MHFFPSELNNKAGYQKNSLFNQNVHKIREQVLVSVRSVQFIFSKAIKNYFNTLRARENYNDNSHVEKSAQRMTTRLTTCLFNGINAMGISVKF